MRRRRGLLGDILGGVASGATRAAISSSTHKPSLEKRTVDEEIVRRIRGEALEELFYKNWPVELDNQCHILEDYVNRLEKKINDLDPPYLERIYENERYTLLQLLQISFRAIQTLQKQVVLLEDFLVSHIHDGHGPEEEQLGLLRNLVRERLKREYGSEGR